MVVPVVLPARAQVFGELIEATYNRVRRITATILLALGVYIALTALTG